MNLLDEIFDMDRIRIMEVNKKEMIALLVVFIIILFLFIIKKNYYYTNIVTNVGESVVLVVDKEMVNQVKNNNEIIINDVDYIYSVNRIEVLEDICFIYTNLDIKINVLNNTYKIYLGKERVLEYIFRILKK